jgi:hypothetical protein
MDIKKFLFQDVPVNKDVVIFILSVLLALAIGVLIGIGMMLDGREGRGGWQDSRSFEVRSQMPRQTNMRYDSRAYVPSPAVQQDVDRTVTTPSTTPQTATQ